VWMSLVHGSTGLIYFVHEFQPKFNESAILSDPDMLSAITAINRQITELAPVLNSPTIEDAADVSSSSEAVPVAMMAKKHNDATYLFAVAMRNDKTTATFTIKHAESVKNVEVIGENRTINVENGVFKDSFEAWDVHLYRTNAL